MAQLGLLALKIVVAAGLGAIIAAAYAFITDFSGDYPTGLLGFLMVATGLLTLPGLASQKIPRRLLGLADGWFAVIVGNAFWYAAAYVVVKMTRLHVSIVRAIRRSAVDDRRIDDLP
jgi:hypothetical protein